MKSLIALLSIITSVAVAGTPIASYRALTTGNGRGFAVFDGDQRQITQLLERPYKYLHPGPDPVGAGTLRRNLVYDAYLGARAGATGAWMRDQAQTELGYVDQTGIIKSVGAVGGVTVESYYFSPFGYGGNALVMLAHVVNPGAGPVTVDVFANPNLHLGGAADPDHPDALGEQITFAGGVGRETGPGGGVALYVPVGGFDRADCAGTGFGLVKSGQNLADTPRSRTGDDLTLSWQKSLGSIPAGGDAWWALAVLFTPDSTGGDATLASWQAFVGARSAQQLLSDERAGWEAWRKPPPAGLSDSERRVWRQAESTLRMGQVTEPWQEAPKHKAEGMLLASLPPGIWHIGWVRDAQYAIVALSRMGHFAEAKAALRFFLDAEANRYMQYTRVPYRISVTRYFGDGQEESDWSAAGPNIEFDGWGLYLWATRVYLATSGDTGWLDEKLHSGERVYDVLRDLVAAPLAYNLDSDGLVGPDTTIWEYHWDNRKHFAYTSLAAARGLCDFTELAHSVGDEAAVASYAPLASHLASGITTLVDDKNVLGGSLEELHGGSGYLDAATVEAFNWDLLHGTAVETATLSAFDNLRTTLGGYKRNDDNASSYDNNEWLVIDLRVASALRRAGRTAEADAVLGWVTSQGALNFDLVPELYNVFPADGALGSFTGAVPMVGFGAGAYILHLLDRDGSVPEPRACAVAAPSVDAGVDGGMTGAGKSGCSDGGAPSGGAWLWAALLFIAVAISRRRGAG